MRIAVVKSAAGAKIPADCREPAPERSPAATATAVAEALADDGHSVTVCEADATLVARLGRLMPPAHDSRVTGMVFNLARAGPHGAPASSIPALLDVAGLPYTGPTVLGHATAFDTMLWRVLLAHAGIPVAPCSLVRWMGGEWRSLRYPVDVTPRYRLPGARGRTVDTRRSLNEALEEVLADEGQEAVIASHLDGAESSCALLGNGDELELLPILERRHPDNDAAGVPTAGTTGAGLRIGALAAAAFKAVHCQDFARIIIRLDRHDRPAVVDVDVTPRVDADSSLVTAAVAGDYGHREVVSRIADIAHHRGFGVAAPRFDLPVWEAPRPSLLRLLPARG